MAVMAATGLLSGTRWGWSDSSINKDGERKIVNQVCFLERMGRWAIYMTKSSSFPHLSRSKESWVVRTEANVRKETKKPPDPPCVVCRGSGQVDCRRCSGQGRTNCVHLTMLPGGEWPKWCRTCGGSGLAHCSRCLGTGKFRHLMGSHFFETDSDDTTALKVQTAD